MTRFTDSPFESEVARGGGGGEGNPPPPPPPPPPRSGGGVVEGWGGVFGYGK